MAAFRLTRGMKQLCSQCVCVDVCGYADLRVNNSTKWKFTTWFSINTMYPKLQREREKNRKGESQRKEEGEGEKESYLETSYTFLV